MSPVFDPTTLGVSGVTVAIMGVILRTMFASWQAERAQSRADLQAERAQNRADLQSATTAMAEFARVAGLLLDRERERGR